MPSLHRVLWRVFNDVPTGMWLGIFYFFVVVVEIIEFETDVRKRRTFHMHSFLSRSSVKVAPDVVQ